MRKTLFVLLALALFACKRDNLLPMNGSGDIRIRIWNSTGHKLEDVFVDSSDGQNEYGMIDAFEKSYYKQFNSAYRFAFVSFKIGDKAFSIQPTGYKGEEPLTKGNYTYKLIIGELDAQYAQLEFIED